MIREPPLPVPEHIVHFRFIHIVVHLEIKGRDQDIDLIENLGKPLARTQSQADIGALSPFGEVFIHAESLVRDLIPQGAKQPVDEIFVSPNRQTCDCDLQIQRRIRQILAFIAPPGHRGAKAAGQGVAEKRGRGIGPVVDIVKESGLPGTRLSPGQQKRIQIQDQGAGRLLLRDLRVENMRFPRREVKTLGSVGVLIQQVPQILRMRPPVGDGENHRKNRLSSWRYPPPPHRPSSYPGNRPGHSRPSGPPEAPNPENSAPVAQQQGVVLRYVPPAAERKISGGAPQSRRRGSQRIKN